MGCVTSRLQNLAGFTLCASLVASNASRVASSPGPSVASHSDAAHDVFSREFERDV